VLVGLRRNGTVGALWLLVFVSDQLRNTVGAFRDKACFELSMEVDLHINSRYGTSEIVSCPTVISKLMVLWVSFYSSVLH